MVSERTLVGMAGDYMSGFQPYFVAFAQAHGKKPDEMQGMNLDFMIWISRKWKEFADEKGYKQTDSAFHGSEFSEWLLSQSHRKQIA